MGLNLNAKKKRREQNRKIHLSNILKNIIQNVRKKEKKSLILLSSHLKTVVVYYTVYITSDVLLTLEITYNILNKYLNCAAYFVCFVFVVVQFDFIVFKYIQFIVFEKKIWHSVRSHRIRCINIMIDNLLNISITIFSGFFFIVT